MKSKGNKLPSGQVTCRLLDDEMVDIVMVNEDGQELIFKRVYSTVEDDVVYVILAPIGGVSGMASNEAMLFRVSEDETLSVSKDWELNHKIFQEYYKTLKEN